MTGLAAGEAAFQQVGLDLDIEFEPVNFVEFDSGNLKAEEEVDTFETDEAHSFALHAWRNSPSA